jgi:DNA-binding beta-propeller fold protein YncE
MNKTLAAAVAALLACSSAQAATAPKGPPKFGITLQHLSSIGTDASADSTGAEIVAYDRKTKRAFAINSQDNDLAVIDLRDPAAPVLIEKVSLDAYGAGLNSVDTHDGLVAVAVEASPKTDLGKVVFLDAGTLAVRGAVTVGAQPDMLTFDDDGQRVLVANEGEPESYLPGAADPEGSISIVDLSRGVARASVSTADFRGFSKEQLLARGVRVFGPGATAAQDLEPEYITVKGRTAWVTLQEANAVAVVDVPTAAITAIVPLGLKDHSIPGQGLDASDRDNANSVRAWPVFGMYQPDAMASFRVGSQQYLVTANEGDARDYDGFAEEKTVRNLVLDPDAFRDWPNVQADAALGRLTVTGTSGDSDGDGDFDELHAFGARSFSIWTTNGEIVWDSGDQFEQFFAAPANGYAGIFNANNTGNARDNRSDNKGPEPEGVAVGKIGGRSFAFIGLERIGGLMAYDVSDPFQPTFAAYANTRGLTTVSGDRGPEGIEFVAAEDSPNGKPLVLVGNEVSRTVSVFQVNAAKR